MSSEECNVPNVYVGTVTGCVKGIKVGSDPGGIRTSSVNLVRNKSEISNKNEVRCMEWTNSCNEMIVAHKHQVKLFDTQLEEFSGQTCATNEAICGVFKNDENVFIGGQSGTIRSYNLSKGEEWNECMKLNGSTIERMKRSSIKPCVIATGGRDNDLKLWNLDSKSMTFSAKNVKPDELQLQVPVWISDIEFARRNENVSISSRHGHVRVYDPLLPQRRPVFNCHHEDQVFTCLSCTPNERQLLVGGGSGDIFLVDTRGKVPFAGKYKGCSGAVKSISCPDSNNLVFSVSLDRHFRIHDFTSRKLLHKEYMVSRLSSVLPVTPFTLQKFEIKKESEEDVDVDIDAPAPKKRKSDAKALDRALGRFEVIE